MKNDGGEEIEEETDDQTGAGLEPEAGTVTDEEAAALKDEEEATDEEEHEVTDKVTFDAKQQAVFDKRLGKEIAKREKAEQAAEEARAEAESARGKVSAHEAEVALVLQLHPSFVTPEEMTTIREINNAETEYDTLADLVGEEDLAVASLPKTTREWLNEKHPGAESVDGKALASRMAQLTKMIARNGPNADAIYSGAKKRQMEALSLGMQIIQMRENARRKVADATDGTKRTEQPGARGSQVPLKSVSRPLSNGAETRGGLNRAQVKAKGGTTLALVQTMEGAEED